MSRGGGPEVPVFAAFFDTNRSDGLKYCILLRPDGFVSARSRAKRLAAVEAMVMWTAGRRMEAGRFDAFRLAQRGEVFAGELDMAALARVADRLAPVDRPATVAWTIEGGQDGLGRPMLTLTLRGNLALVCQRCLQPCEVAVDQRSELLIAHDQAELKRLDADEREVVLASSPLDVRTLVEDEMLLSLPFAPMHPEAECAPRASAGREVGQPGQTLPFKRSPR
jgi:uncharacterized protein